MNNGNLNCKQEDIIIYHGSKDEKLRIALGSKEKITKRDEFTSAIQQWQTRTNSKTFAIVFHDKAISKIIIYQSNILSFSASFNFSFARKDPRIFIDFIVFKAKSMGMSSFNINMPKAFISNMLFLFSSA